MKVWKNSKKLWKQHTASFSFSQTSARVSITRLRHGICFLFLKHNLKWNWILMFFIGVTQLKRYKLIFLSCVQLPSRVYGIWVHAEHRDPQSITMLLLKQEQERKTAAFHYGHRCLRGPQQHLHVQITDDFPEPFSLDETTMRYWTSGLPSQCAGRSACSESKRRRHLVVKREAGRLEQRQRKQQ